MLFLFQNAACSSKPRRRPGNWRAYHKAGGAGLAVLMSVSTPLAQETPASARQFTLDVAQRLEWSDNPDLAIDGEDRLLARTSLRFGLERRTGIDRLSFSLGGDLEVSNDDATGFERPSLSLAWQRDVGHSQIGAAFDFNEVELGNTTSTTFDEDTQSTDFITVDSGARQTANLSLTGAFGIEAPFGGSYRLSQRQVRYVDTSDSDLQDADRLSFDGDLHFELDPRITLGLAAAYTDFDEEGPGDLDTVTSRVESYLELDVTPRLTSRIGLGWQEIEQSGTSDLTRDGLVFDASLTQALPRSTMELQTQSRITSNGRRNELRFIHSLERPLGSLRYSLGVSQTEDLDPAPLFGLSWRRELPRGAVSVDLEQVATTDTDDAEVVNSQLSLSYQQDLTTRSGFGLEFVMRDSDERADSGTDSRSYNLGLTYRHAVTEDWDFTGGISMVRVEEDGTADRDSNTVFIGLQRQLVWN
ncbi:hypothetical protein SAMN06295998_12029 [Primorskyibacter flagellatus]|uniref:TIGR03016 family PEP-CTERM system-associated outer membrane protein n=1 Tax=Primorskyibacter flagellatus TaxID=1387277 RepID=A0A1W2E078_9RHOB|nr:hypothetical protein SAMN06295998_12029 [Primorskyibacter flagellatus]